MKTVELLRESAVAALRRLAPSIMIALLVAAACATTVLTVGRTAAAEDQVRARLDSAGARLINVQDVSGAGLIDSSSVSVISSLNTVERAVALSLPVDAQTAAQGPGGTKLPIWEIRGDTTSAVRITEGRLPAAGEAVISGSAARAAGLDAPVGAVVSGTRTWAIVGFYTARAPFADLEKGVIAPAASTSATPLLYVIARSATEVQSVADDIRRVISPPDDANLAFSVPSTLADLQAAVSTDLGGLGHSLLVLILAAGSSLVALVVFADTLVRRSDLGRRRALGMARSSMVAFILLRTAICAVVGAVLGCAAGGSSLALTDAAPSISFISATGVLAVVTAALAAVPPGLAAAFADPVRVLRTP